MRVIGRFEQQAIDRLWQQRTGLPLLVLMEHAAAAVVKRGREMVEAAATVFFWRARETTAVMPLPAHGCWLPPGIV